jgi:hypothetical protein
VAPMGFVADLIHELHRPGFDYRLALHLHTAVYLSWLAMLTVQTACIGKGRVARHRRPGVFGAATAALVVLARLVATQVVDNRLPDTPRADPAVVRARLIDVLIFATLATAALVLRRDGAAQGSLRLPATMSRPQAGSCARRALPGTPPWARVRRQLDGRLPRWVAARARTRGLRSSDAQLAPPGRCTSARVGYSPRGLAPRGCNWRPAGRSSPGTSSDTRGDHDGTRSARRPTARPAPRWSATDADDGARDVAFS